VLERLWAGWRSAYLDGLDGGGAPDRAPSTGSIFERILSSGLPDEQTFIVWRGTRCFALLNLYPYTSGHVLVLPNVAVRDLEDLDDETAEELWRAVRQAVVAVRAAYQPDGINVGANLGQAAGAGVPDHLHLHVVPRWAGDTSFTTTVAETRVMPEPLSVTWHKIVAAWP
jgi:ATP adenylyltransferase